jgi:hypothetical protein
MTFLWLVNLNLLVSRFCHYEIRLPELFNSGIFRTKQVRWPANGYHRDCQIGADRIERKVGTWKASPARLLLNVQKSWGVARATMAVFHLTVCPTQSRLEICPLGSQCPAQISSPLNDFHVASGGPKSLQTNSKADRDDDALHFFRSLIRNLKVFHPRSTQLCLYPKRSGRSVKLSMLCRRRAAIVAAGGQIAIISLSS